MTSIPMPVHAAAPADPLRILVAEDEFLTRMLVSDHLREDGFIVLEAASGDEAIDILKSGAVIDLVFTDVQMPGSHDGMALLDFVKRAWPELPVVMTSGRLESALAYASGAADFLTKPCDLDIVVNAIRTALQASA